MYRYVCICDFTYFCCALLFTTLITDNLQTRVFVANSKHLRNCFDPPPPFTAPRKFTLLLHLCSHDVCIYVYRYFTAVYIYVYAYFACCLLKISTYLQTFLFSLFFLRFCILQTIHKASRLLILWRIVDVRLGIYERELTVLLIRFGNRVIN